MRAECTGHSSCSSCHGWVWVEILVDLLGTCFFTTDGTVMAGIIPWHFTNRLVNGWCWFIRKKRALLGHRMFSRYQWYQWNQLLAIGYHFEKLLAIGYLQNMYGSGIKNIVISHRCFGYAGHRILTHTNKYNYPLNRNYGASADRCPPATQSDGENEFIFQTKKGFEGLYSMHIDQYDQCSSIDQYYLTWTSDVFHKNDVVWLNMSLP